MFLGTQKDSVFQFPDKARGASMSGLMGIQRHLSWCFLGEGDGQDSVPQEDMGKLRPEEMWIPRTTLARVKPRCWAL